MLTTLFRRLRPFVRCTGTHGHAVLAAALLLSLVCAPLALRLEIDAELSSLLPSEYPTIRALERLRETIGGEDDVAVAISSPDFAANRAFAETLIDAAMELQSPGGEPYFSRCEFRRDTGFLERNALYFATGEELDALEEYLGRRLERARLESSPLYFDLEKREAAGKDSLSQRLEEIYARLVQGEYPVSADSTVLAVKFHPAVSQTNFARIQQLYAALDSLAAALQPEGFHPDMEVTTAGRLLRRFHEVRAISSDVGRSFGAGVLAVLITVVFYFSYKSSAPSGSRSRAATLAAACARMPVMAVVIGLPFLMSLSWTFAVTYLWLGGLNLMTSILALLLFGLGIDYGIHFYARYAEERGNGLEVADAIEITFASTGQAVAVGAMTTAGGLAVLVLGDFRGFSHFGLIATVGIAFALLAMMVVMPALVAVCERLGLLSLAPRKPVQPRVAGDGRFPLAGLVTAGALGSVLIGVLAFPGTEFEYRFGELEPVYGEYNKRRDEIRKVFPPGGGRNQAYIVADSPAEARAAADTLTPTIAGVVTLQDRFPMEESGTAGQAAAHRRHQVDPRGAVAAGRGRGTARPSARRGADPRPALPGRDSLLPEESVPHQYRGDRPLRAHLTVRGTVGRPQLHRLSRGCGDRGERGRNGLSRRLTLPGRGRDPQAGAPGIPLDGRRRWGAGDAADVAELHLPALGRGRSRAPVRRDSVDGDRHGRLRPAPELLQHDRAAGGSRDRQRRRGPSRPPLPGGRTRLHTAGAGLHGRAHHRRLADDGDRLCRPPVEFPPWSSDHRGAGHHRPGDDLAGRPPGDPGDPAVPVRPRAAARLQPAEGTKRLLPGAGREAGLRSWTNCSIRRT